MKFFSYAMAYAVIVFLIYLLTQLFRFVYVRLKAYMLRRKLTKGAVTQQKKSDLEKKDD